MHPNKLMDEHDQAQREGDELRPPPLPKMLRVLFPVSLMLFFVLLRRLEKLDFRA